MNVPSIGQTSRTVAGLIVIGMVCFAPWAFGSVQAWAILCLDAAIAAVITLLAIADGTSQRARRLLCGPSLGLLGLVVLALFQAAPIPSGWFAWISPGAAALRAELLPPAPETVIGDAGPTVPLPSPRLSQNPDETLRTAARLAGGWLLFQGVLGLGGGSARVRHLAIAFAANAALLSFFSIVQALSWNGRIFWVGPLSPGSAWSTGGPFVNHTHLAEYLNMGLGMALGLALPGGWRGFSRGKTNRAWAGYAACVITAGIIASNSRGGFLATMAAGTIMALALRSHAVGIGLGAAAMLATVVILLAAMGDASPYLDRIMSIIEPGNEGYAIRGEIWRGTLRTWWQSPIWGAGLGSFPVAVTPFLETDREVFFARAENEYVDLLAEGGLVGVALLLTILVGVARWGYRAWEIAPNPTDRGLALGASFGLIALGLNSLSDFGPHIPGVGVPAIILAATLCRLGLAAGEQTTAENVVPRTRRLAGAGWALGGLATASAGLALGLLGSTEVRLESILRAAGLPRPNESTPAMDDLARTRPELERQRAALVAATRLRPDWSDGHLRLGMVNLALYQATAAEWLRDAGMGESPRTANHLWLLGVVHAARHRSQPVPSATLLDHDPVRLYLVPAARSFLEARRSCPVSFLAHAELASLDYLLEGKPAAAALGRVLRLAGSRGGSLAYAAEIAAGVGDERLATRCWRRTLEVSPGRWAGVADAASAILTPDQILEEVVPSGRLALLFADRLYPESEPGPARAKFLRVAARDLPADPKLDQAEKLQLEAHAWAALDEREPARARIEAALALQPENFTWRQDLIKWLLRWDRVEEAHEQAKIGVYYAPNDKATLDTLNGTADALARRESTR